MLSRLLENSIALEYPPLIGQHSAKVSIALFPLTLGTFPSAGRSLKPVVSVVSDLWKNRIKTTYLLPPPLSPLSLSRLCLCTIYFSLIFKRYAARKGDIL